jgi:hypothetical protein
MKKTILLFVLLALLLPMGVQAQNEVRLTFLEVDLWPEYDRPTMLVIFRAQISADTSLPVEVSFRIPIAAGEPNAVAVGQPDGSLLNASYTYQEAGQWTTVTVTATTPDIQLEYYDPQLEKDGAARHYEFTWLGMHDVDEMLVQIQQPVGAGPLRVEPALGQQNPGSDGLQYYDLEIGAPVAGESVSVSIGYQKSDDALSIESFQLQPSEPISTTTGGIDALTVLPWLLGGIGVLLVVGGLVWYWQSGRGTPSPKRKSTPRGRRASADRTIASPTESGKGVYCHQCGKRAGPGDRFCRACGTQLR